MRSPFIEGESSVKQLTYQHHRFNVHFSMPVQIGWSFIGADFLWQHTLSFRKPHTYFRRTCIKAITLKRRLYFNFDLPNILWSIRSYDKRNLLKASRRGTETESMWLENLLNYTGIHAPLQTDKHTYNERERRINISLLPTRG